MTEKRKILFLMPSLRGGGAERTLINLLHKIDQDLYEIDLLVVLKDGPYVDKIPDHVEVNYLFKSRFLARFLGYLHRMYGLSWFFRNRMMALDTEYDVGISFLDSHYTDLLFHMKNLKRRVAFVHSSYLSHSDYEKFSSNDNLRKKADLNRYSRLDGIYFVSHDSMADFVELFGEGPNMGVVYNIIDREAVLQKARNESGTAIKDDLFSFSAVGSLLPVKGFDRLIRASRIARDKGYEFNVHIAGAGPEEGVLKNMIKEFGLENTIILHGFVNNPYPLMKSSDVFVMSSLSEALPTVLCEAMILGVPSLVTNCSGCRGLVEDGEYGMAAEQDDHDFAKKMMLYMDKPELLEHYSKKSLERAMLFDDDRILKKYYNIFEGKEPNPA
ncbi:glycosyltransferase [Rhodohalobacter mucosus]|uniref:Uncharacterized protein n=1 Tax=Rhodohalobacter mucosus TaxID=2079485 RepID=A0A316TYG3_9BACT|nr:glycosyltransferase [Rhodohalobacter mucosus]PWN07804.1 hypothetical protein DDZ15_01975 [Rhodohalobacter mucosus]